MSPWWEFPVRRLLLLDEGAILRGLHELAGVRRAPPPGPVGAAVRRGVPATLPNPWQVALGVARMQHRLLTRPGTVGLARAPRVPGWSTWWLEHQLVRAPFLLLEGTVVPGDLSGLRSSPTTLVRHLLGTFHAGAEANYDLEILAARAPAMLATLRTACVDVIADRHPRAARWKKLCVYEGAHTALLPRIEAALQGRFLDNDGDEGGGSGDDGDSPGNPDVSFFAFLRFCARQPADAAATWAAWRAGRLHFAHGGAGLP
jgi:hypothetical protein